VINHEIEQFFKKEIDYKSDRDIIITYTLSSYLFVRKIQET